MADEVKIHDLTKMQDPYAEKRYISKEAKADSKYGKLVFEFPMENNEIEAEGVGTDFVYRPQAYFRGASQIPGSEFNQSFQVMVKPYFLDRIPHRHSKDEYLIFLGASFTLFFIFLVGSGRAVAFLSLLCIVIHFLCVKCFKIHYFFHSCCLNSSGEVD